MLMSRAQEIVGRKLYNKCDSEKSCLGLIRDTSRGLPGH